MKTLYPTPMIVLILSFLSSGFISNAQSYYPAGLGNANLKLWLTAADPSTLLTATGTQAANGNAIATWTDKSGNAAHATQATVGAQPVYQTNALNGNGAVIFQNTSQYMTGKSGAYQTIISARGMTGTSYQYLFSSPANSDFSVRYTGGTATTHYTDGPNGNDWCYNTGNSQWVNGSQSLSGSTTNHILVDQASAATNNTYSLSSTFMSRGMYNNDPVYELLAYNNTLNTTSRVLLENYEAAAWGMTSNLPATGYTKFTPPTANTYNKNLVGIGYTSNTDNFLSSIAGSTDGLGFSSGTSATDFLNTAGYLMAAHNGQANTVKTNPVLSGLPANSYIWNRSWYLNANGGNSNGNVTLTFNFSDYNGSTPMGSYHFGIFFNAADGSYATGSNKKISYSSLSVSGNSVSFVVKASSLANGYYTIVYNPLVVLPVTLTNFKVTATGNSNNLQWSTEQELNSDHFNVQRSSNGSNFTSIGTVDAAGNATGSINYSFSDNNPINGNNFYRLQRVDMDGNTAYSKIIEVSSKQQHNISVYPNPMIDQLHIQIAGVAEAGTLEIINAAGQTVSIHPVSNIAAATLSVANLQKGMYYLRIKSASTLSIQKLSKQ
jgi:hypothetical protein